MLDGKETTSSHNIYYEFSCLREIEMTFSLKGS